MIADPLTALGLYGFIGALFALTAWLLWNGGQ